MEMVIPGTISYFFSGNLKKSLEKGPSGPRAGYLDVPIYVLLTRVSSHDQINSQFK
jgi:hypothetical protein